jgi:hypothetical protein
MAEEMILENVPWESDEAQDWESDEAFAESDESAEDLGEAARRRPRRKSPYLRARGVRGMTLRGPDGVRNVSFPTKLATTAETNRGLATQELARQNLEERLDRFEARRRGDQRNDVSTIGLVTLAIGGGLTLLGAVDAAKASPTGKGGTFNSWASQSKTQIASFVSATQLATTGAKFALTGKYPRSPFGFAADAFAVAQLAAFAFGSFSTNSLRTPPKVLANQAVLDDGNTLQNLSPFDVVMTGDDHKTWEIIADDSGKKFYREIDPD